LLGAAVQVGTDELADPAQPAHPEDRLGLGAGGHPMPAARADARPEPPARPPSDDEQGNLEDDGHDGDKDW